MSFCHIGVRAMSTSWLCNEQSVCDWLKFSLISKSRNNFRLMVSSSSLLCYKIKMGWFGRGDGKIRFCLYLFTVPLSWGLEASWNQDANGDLRRAGKPAASASIQQPRQEVDANSPNCLSFANEAMHEQKQGWLEHRLSGAGTSSCPWLSNVWASHSAGDKSVLQQPCSLPLIHSLFKLAKCSCAHPPRFYHLVFTVLVHISLMSDLTQEAVFGVLIKVHIWKRIWLPEEGGF